MGEVEDRVDAKRCLYLKSSALIEEETRFAKSKSIVHC